MSQSSTNWEGTLDRLTAQNYSHMKVLLCHVYSVPKEMPGARSPWCKMVMRFVDKEGKGLYAEVRGQSVELVTKAAQKWTAEGFFASNLNACKSKFFAGHYVDLSDRGSKAAAQPLALSHPQVAELQKVFPVARSDFEVMEKQCQGRERADVIGVVTKLELPPTNKPKANVWLKDLSGKEMLVNIWGERLVAVIAQASVGQVVQIDNCSLIKRSECSLEGTAEHFLDNDKHGFAFMRIAPGARSERLRALGAERGRSRSLGARPWACFPCFVACAATMNAFGLAMEQGDLQAGHGHDLRQNRSIQDKGAHVLCFKGPFDLRLGTSPRLATSRGAAPSASQASQASAPGTSVFANYVTLLAVAEDDPAIDEIDVAGDRHLVTKHEKVHPYPRKDGDAAFAIEAFCHFKSCHLFNMADGSPRFLVGRVLKNENTGGITLHVEWMSRVSQDQLLHLQEERDMVWCLLGLEPQLQDNKRPASSLVDETHESEVLDVVERLAGASHCLGLRLWSWTTASGFVLTRSVLSWPGATQWPLSCESCASTGLGERQHEAEDVAEADMAWIRAAQLEISERYARGPWTAVDYAVWFFCYDLGSIADWPVDAVVVQTAHRQKCLLGSLRSAADLRAAEALMGTRASVVVSVCWEAEMTHFQESGVTHLQVPLDDLRIVYAPGSSWSAPSSAPRLGAACGAELRRYLTSHGLRAPRQTSTRARHQLNFVHDV
ncbi:unnamed protein product [Effrenium voratum]|nr:unnamed protein product [Effrenium voratum]